MPRRRKKDSGDGGTPSWLNTYADMVTLVLTFFVLLYSFSNLDTNKFNTFLASFKGGGILNYGDSPFEEYASGPYFEASDQALANEATSVVTIDATTAQTMEMVQNYIEEMGMESEITVSADERGVALNIKDRILFDSGKADLKPEAKAILDPLAKLFGTIKYEIWVEGHTDNRPINTREYPTNWELSTARASRVIRYFVENKGLDPKKFVAIGYGEYRPVAPNDSPEHMQQNRRVVMVIRMPANETEVNSNE